MATKKKKISTADEIKALKARMVELDDVVEKRRKRSDELKEERAEENRQWLARDAANTRKLQKAVTERARGRDRLKHLEQKLTNEKAQAADDDED